VDVEVAKDSCGDRVSGEPNVTRRHHLSKKTDSLHKPPSQKVMLRIPSDDLDRARRQAAGKGIGYHTYIKMLLDEGLDRQEQSRRGR